MKTLELNNYTTSRGPRALKEPIDYVYQSFENVYNFFKIFKFDCLCIPTFNVRFNNYVVRSAIALETNTEKYWIPEKAKVAIKKCMAKKKKRFIYISLIICRKVSNLISHANIIIIDVLKKTVERFEPYGWTLENHDFVNYFMKKVCIPELEIHDFKYIAPERLSEKKGIQTVADSYNGMCITISMLYLHLRLLNPDISARKIVKYLLKLPISKLKTLILKYAKYVEDKLKENHIIVNNLNNELYTTI